MRVIRELAHRQPAGNFAHSNYKQKRVTHTQNTHDLKAPIIMPDQRGGPGLNPSAVATAPHVCGHVFMQGPDAYRCGHY